MSVDIEFRLDLLPNLGFVVFLVEFYRLQRTPTVEEATEAVWNGRRRPHRS
jgi:hypothetical protein